MKRKITKKYMFVFSISITVIIVLWMVLTYAFVLSGNVGNNNEPQYLVNLFEQYLDDSNGLKISEEGKKILWNNDLWAQIIDKKGNVLETYNAPKEALDSYHIFEITNYTMNSNTLGTQTIFISQFSKQSNYGVIIGCDSSKVSKISIKFTGGMTQTVIKSIIILLVVFIVTGLCAGMFFSKNISTPINDMIENINRLETDQNYKGKNNKNSIFKSVFDSLDKLRLRLASADVERKNAEDQREEWITNISHDIKTPLSTIRGYTEIMLDDEYEVSDQERKMYSGKIIKNAEVIKNLIDELKFGRSLEHGEIKEQKEEVNICRLLKECCSDFSADYKAGTITFDFEYEAIYATIDKQLMRRCFMNIICNAIIHNNSNVDLVINCYQADKIIVEISDNGKGMSSDELNQVFKRYYRGKTSKETAGSGLGLAIAKEIVNAHNGEISVKSEEGKGSVFTISI